MRVLDLFKGTRGDMTRRFQEIEDSLCQISQMIGDMRINVIDFIDQATETETAFESRMAEVADHLQKSRESLWTAIGEYHDALPDYIAEGYPGSKD